MKTKKRFLRLKWYKTLDRSQVLFENIIDSNDISTYDLNISFDQAYWEQQANQRITDNINFNTCFKQGWTSCYSWIENNKGMGVGIV